MAVLPGNLSIWHWILKYEHVPWIRHCARYRDVPGTGPHAQGMRNLRVAMKHPQISPAKHP